MREEYKRGFGVPTLIAVHPVNDPKGEGFAQAKAYAAATGGDRAGVLESSFVAEVKSDLMGEQTILCGMLQTGAVLSFDKMVAKGVDAGYASKLIQFGWETITEALKQGGITGMMDRLDNPSKVRLPCRCHPALPPPPRDILYFLWGPLATSALQLFKNPGKLTLLPTQIKAFELSEELKEIMTPLYKKHQDDIITGE